MAQLLRLSELFVSTKHLGNVEANEQALFAFRAVECLLATVAGLDPFRQGRGGHSPTPATVRLWRCRRDRYGRERYPPLALRAPPLADALRAAQG